VEQTDSCSRGSHLLAVAREGGAQPGIGLRRIQQGSHEFPAFLRIEPHDFVLGDGLVCGFPDLSSTKSVSDRPAN
jgi:hypothetical protein